MTIKLGSFYRDLITGFGGVATGYVNYITGCNQVLLAPKVGPDGAIKSAEWIDEQRLILDPYEAVIVLDNGSSPGFDRAAPKR